MSATKILVLLFGIAALICPSLAQDSDKCCPGPRTLKARGEAYEEVAKNFTLVKFKMYSQGQSAFNVAQEVTRNSDKVLDFLESKSDVVFRTQNTGTSLSARYTYPNGTRTFQDYQGVVTITFEVEVVNSDVLDKILDFEGVVVDSISKKASYEDIVAAQKVAQKNAVYNSRVNAENILSGIGETLGKALYVESNANGYLQSGGGSLQVLRAEASVTYEIIG